MPRECLLVILLRVSCLNNRANDSEEVIFCVMPAIHALSVISCVYLYIYVFVFFFAEYNLHIYTCVNIYTDQANIYQ